MHQLTPEFDHLFYELLTQWRRHEDLRDDGDLHELFEAQQELDRLRRDVAGARRKLVGAGR